MRCRCDALRWVRTAVRIGLTGKDTVCVFPLLIFGTFHLKMILNQSFPPKSATLHDRRGTPSWINIESGPHPKFGRICINRIGLKRIKTENSDQAC